MILPISGPAAQTSPREPRTIAELEQQIQTILSTHDVPGAAIALVTGDKRLWIDGIGYANAQTRTPAHANTIFRWGSVSKSVVSVAILMLQQRGLVHLSDRIHDIAPEVEFHNRWESKHPVRLVHCLEHTTGFDDLHFNECAVADPAIGLSDALAISPNARRSRWEPGSYKSYCNVGPVIAARVVEIATGRSFEEFVRDEIFVPMEMNTSSFSYPLDTALMATGYEHDGATPVPYDYVAYRPSASLNAPAQDMASFVQALLNRGAVGGTALLTPQSVQRMETPTTTLAARAGFPLGYGLGNYTTLRNGYVFHGHGGMIAGFVASYGYNRELDRGYAISINKASDEALQEIVDAVVAYFTAGTEPANIPKESPSAQDLMSLAGYYQSMTPMSQLLHVLLLRFVNVRKVTVENGALLSGNFIFGRQRQLVPIASRGFHRKGTDESVVFIADGNDTVICYDGLRGNFKRTSPYSVFFQLGAFILSLCLMASSVLFAMVWIPRKLLGRMKNATHLKARVFPLLSVLFFLVTYVSLLNGLMLMEIDKAVMARLGFFTVHSFTVFVSSVCFAAFSFIGLFFSLRAFIAERKIPAHIHSLLVSIVNVAAAIYLWYGGVVGIATWSY